MTIEKLERVMWRLESGHNHAKKEHTNDELRRAVMYEVGVDKRTYQNVREQLKKLGWIEIKNRMVFKVTGKHLTGE